MTPHLKHTREKLSATISSIRQAGGSRLVVQRWDGSVLQERTGTYAFDLRSPLEVGADTDPVALWGDSIVTINEAARGARGRGAQPHCAAVPRGTAVNDKRPRGSPRGLLSPPHFFAGRATKRHWYQMPASPPAQGGAECALVPIDLSCTARTHLVMRSGIHS